MKNILLENEFVLLRPIELGDIAGVAAVSKDERIWSHMSDLLMTDDAVEAYVNKAIAEREAGQSYKFVIVEKRSGAIIGSTSFLDIADGHKRLEIGATWISPTVWRTAMNTNCKYLLLQYCFDVLQLNRVQIKTGHENLQSQRAIERIGATKEGVLRNHMLKRDGSIRHTVMYSVTLEEWPKVKARFQQELLL